MVEEDGDRPTLIPDKRYFRIGEVSTLCEVPPHVLRYWEQEFSQLKMVQRRGNRRYYQRHEVRLVLQIKKLLYAEGYTISGARNKLEQANANGNASAATSEQSTAAAAAKAGNSGEVAALAKEVQDIIKMLK